MAHILLIDDDDVARMTTRVMLERAGHTVRTANDGNEGLAAFAEGDVELVVTDIIMPDKEGIETLTDLRRIDPNARIVAISGGGRAKNMDLLGLAAQLGADATLQKPFRAQQLTEAVDTVLARGTAA